MPLPLTASEDGRTMAAMERVRTCRNAGTPQCPHLQERAMGIALSMTSFGENTMKVVIRSYAEGKQMMEDVERRLCQPCTKYEPR